MYEIDKNAIYNLIKVTRDNYLDAKFFMVDMTPVERNCSRNQMLGSNLLEFCRELFSDTKRNIAVYIVKK
jgi:hypothetical protein